jgi:hypothetical protein
VHTSLRLLLCLTVLSPLCLSGCSDDGLTGLTDSLHTPVDALTSGLDAAIETSTPEVLEDTSIADGTIEDTLEPSDVSVTETAPEPEPKDWGDPIQAKPNQWQWIDFPNTFCADGSPTGLGVNLSPNATRALIYFEGGGACWDYASCTGLIETSFHLNGFDEGDFNSLLIDVYKNMLLYDRNEPKNPFSDAHYVFVPYCTGDVFSGDNVTEVKGLLPWNKETMHFKGAHNVAEYLKRLAPTFAELDEVYLAGSSAGGFGAGFSWHSAREAFSPIPVHVIDDSGPPIQPKGGLWESWKEAWNMQFPEQCPQCSKGLDEVVKFFQETMLKDAKLAVITYSNDPIIATFLKLAPWDFTAGLKEIYAALDTSNNAHYFVVPGLLHTMLIGQNELVEGPDGTPLWFWISNMVQDDANWKSIKP